MSVSKIPVASSVYSFGLEEEFFVCSADTGDLASSGAGLLLESAREHLGTCVTSEMLQSQIEITSPVFTQVDEADLVLRSLRRRLGDISSTLGLSLVAAGTHPSGTWREQLITDQSRYERLLTDFRIVGHRNLVCGLHVHVAIPPGVDRIDVMNRAMRWLPLFLSLTTSSPFWSGQVTGLLSYRQTLYDEWPRSGIPDFFDSEADYHAFTDRMESAGALRDAGQLWWAIRPAARFPTLELRIADACTHVEDSLAIASLYRCLIATLVEYPEIGRHRTSHTRRIIDENRWRAKRDGIDAQFIAEASSDVVCVRRVLSDLLERLAPTIQRFQCADALLPLQDILDSGTSAHEQLRIYNDRRAAGDGEQEALRAVLKWLAHSTTPASRTPLPFANKSLRTHTDARL